EGELPSILEMIRNARPDGVRARWIENLEQEPRWDANYFLGVSESLAQQIQAKGSRCVRIMDVSELRNDRVDPRRGSGTFLYIEISDVSSTTASCTAKTVHCHEAPSRARKLVRAGDVLVSTVRPERKTVAVVGSELDGAVCTTGFA